jgi:hypothetical protein
MTDQRLDAVFRISVVAMACALVPAAGLSLSRESQTCTTFVPPSPAPSASPLIEVTYLGVGGFLLRSGKSAIMTPPLYSNPTVGEIALSELYPDGERIDRLMHYDVTSVRAIVVGHGHYDHAMDLPYIAAKRATAASIYGSKTLLNLLDPLRSKSTLVDAETRALCKVAVDKPFKDPCPQDPEDEAPCSGHHSFDVWEEGSKSPRFRIWPIVSEHSAPFGPGMLKIPLVKFDPVVGWRGQLLHPRETFPTRAGDWTGGTTLAYVIDVLDAMGQAMFRVYYQDSPTRKHIGYPPPCLLEQRPIDLALLCAGGASEEPIKGKFPRDIVRALQPRFVIGGHWEDLFKPRDLPLPGKTKVKEPIRAAPGVKLEDFKKDVKKELPTGGRVTIPCPEDLAYFVKQNGTWHLRAGSSETARRWTLEK